MPVPDPAPPRAELSSGWGRALVFAYGVFAVAATGRSLLQLGTDEKLGMNWGDNGQLYLWIRRDDLRARRFDKAWLVLQCH